MSVATDTEHAGRLELEAPTGFTKIVVGLEADESSFEATRQAALLLQRNGLLTLMAAYQPLAAAPVWGAFSIAYLEPELREMLKKQAVEQLWRAREIATHVEPEEAIEAKTQEEATAAALVSAASANGADLIAIGSPRSGRLWGILAGQTATFVLHRAPCSVLVARAPVIAAFKRITVGIDGSPASARALEVARIIAKRFHSELRVVAAYGGFELDLEALDRDYTSSAGNPVDALLSFAGASDLLVVGSRGSKGIRSLGSVSERVAHEAVCSVLVVR